MKREMVINGLVLLGLSSISAGAFVVGLDLGLVVLGTACLFVAFLVEIKTSVANK